MHQKGADGARRAKTWLDATTRTRATWTNEDAVAAGRLTFNWPFAGQNEFSFDVGGILFGEPFDNHAFVAEVKNYSGPDLGGDFDDFLAKCYVVARDHPKLANQFMFMTWHPFRVTTWTKLTDRDSVVSGCLTDKNRRRLLDTDVEADARGLLDPSVVDDVCENLWLIVLSQKQEQLLISNDDRALIVQKRIEKGLA